MPFIIALAVSLVGLFFQGEKPLTGGDIIWLVYGSLSLLLWQLERIEKAIKDK